MSLKRWLHVGNDGKGCVVGTYDGRVELKAYMVGRRKTKELGLVWVSVL